MAALATSIAAQPVISGLQNNYSYMLPGTPSYAFAQGGIFILYGSAMAPAGLLTAGFDPTLDRNLGGVSIKITVNGVTTEAVPYYVSPSQISAILPSATPVGLGSITVAYNGATSAPFPIEVVPGAFGLLTMSGNGIGQVVVQDANYGYLTSANAVREGQIVIFWGTGLGSDPNDETRLIAAPQNLSGPFELFIGNKPAEVLYYGRSQFPGLDQIVARVPVGMSGCFVSVYAKTGRFISNFTTMPVGAEGGCRDTFVTPAEAQTFARQESVTSGWLQLGIFDHYNPGGSFSGVMIPPSTTITHSATAQFLRYTPFDYVNYGGLSQPSFGSCVVNTFATQSPFVPPFIEGFEAGDVTLTLPDGSVRQMPRVDLAYILSGVTGGAPLFIPDTGGRFTFAGTGGPQVGAFSASLTVPPAFTWNEQKTLADVDLNQSLTVTWGGGDPDSYVVVTGTALDLDSVFTIFACTERVSVGRITIPRDVLASMIPSPVNPNFPAPTGQMIVYNYAPPEKFSAQGVDNGNIGYFVGYTTMLHYRR